MGEKEKKIIGNYVENLRIEILRKLSHNISNMKFYQTSLLINRPRRQTIRAMVNLVKIIESSPLKSSPRFDEEMKRFMKVFRKQLKSNKADLNKLRQSTKLLLLETIMVTPLHAAIIMKNEQIIQELLETKGVDADRLAIRKIDNEYRKFGVLDVTFLGSGIGTENEESYVKIVELLLEHNRTPSLGYYIQSGVRAPFCLSVAVVKEWLEVLDLFHSISDHIEGFSPFYSLGVAIFLGNSRVFNHLLPLAANYADRLITYDGKNLSLVELASAFGKTEMLEQLQMVMGIGGSYNADNRKMSTTLGDEVIRSKDDSLLTCDVSPKEAKEDDADRECKVVDFDMEKTCWQCDNYGKFKCSGCLKARFCGEKCQLEHWDGHKKYCLAKMNRIAFREFKSFSPSIFN